MNQRRIGRTGLKVSEICLGTMTFGGQCDEPTSHQILSVAADRGVTFLDTADAYPIPPDPETAGRTEEIIGRWLAAGPGRRDQLVLATKCRIRVGLGPNDQGLSRRHVLAACNASLRRLRTDYIDLYQSHLPDPETPIDETLRTFDDLVRSGKVRYAGCSNYPAWQLALAAACSERHGWARYDCIQPRYNVLYREIENELIPLCRDQGIGVIVYNPLAGGLLTGKHSAEAPPSRVPGSRWEHRASSTATATGTPPSLKSSRNSRRTASSAAGTWRRPAWPGCSLSRASLRRLSAPAGPVSSMPPWPRRRLSSMTTPARRSTPSGGRSRDGRLAGEAVHKRPRGLSLPRDCPQLAHSRESKQTAPQGRRPWRPLEAGRRAKRRIQNDRRLSFAAVWSRSRTSTARQPCGPKKNGPSSGANCNCALAWARGCSKWRLSISRRPGETMSTTQ